MPPLPIISGNEAAKTFARLGWTVDHQTGSHMIMYKAGAPTLSIPNHRELAIGLLRGLVRTAGLSVDEFLQAHQK